MKSHRIPQWQEDETTQYKESDREGGVGAGIGLGLLEQRSVLQILI